MEVTDALIEKLATLSRLYFNGEEKEKIKIDLQNMIRMAEKMNELDTAGVEPLLHINANINIMREDIPEKGMDNETALKNAARSEPPYFVVPKMIKK